MNENARRKRRYDAPRRRAQAADTQVAIIAAAARVFLERGYVGATIPLIAAAAGVAVETVYRSASGKAGLMAAAVNAALAGGTARAAVPVEQRPAIRAVIEETDPQRQLLAYAATQAGVWDRVGPLLRVLDVAATTDRSLAELRNRLAAQRRDGLGRFVALLSSRGALREGLTEERATDILCTICAQAPYDSLVTERGWAAEEYRDWIAESLIHSLLRPR